MYFRNISHFPLGDTPVHVTYRLHGSVPRVVLERLAAKRSDALRRIASKAGSRCTEAWKRETDRLTAREEQILDRYLHGKRRGPMHLARPDLNKLVVDSWRHLDAERSVILYAVTVMSNHVHAVISAPAGGPPLPLGKLMNRHKRFTARAANRLLGTTGQPFWDTNYYDRTVRDRQFFTVMWYVLNNPVKAGLVRTWQAYPGTYVKPRYQGHFMD